MVNFINNIIVHVSEVEITENSGMGRVEFYWQQAFERAGFQFIHIGPNQVGKVPHKGLFPYLAYQYFKKLNIKPVLILAHEPASGAFINKGTPVFVESHGLERPFWEISKDDFTIKTRLLYPIWRLRNCDNGLRYADKLLLINNDDATFANNYYQRKPNDIFVFKNGVKINSLKYEPFDTTKFTILFNGSWIKRKGIDTLVECAKKLFQTHYNNFHYLLIGTGKSKSDVLIDWPAYLKPFVEVIPEFNAEEEIDYLNQANLFVLPSISEGQPLSLLQAMSLGKCCITTNCCGQKDIIKHEENGLLFTVGDFMELYNMILKCYGNNTFIKKIQENARISTAMRTWENVSDEVVNFIIK